MKQILLILFLFCFSFKAFALKSFEPVAIDSRIKTFIYSENEIYNLKFRIGYNSIIEFSQDESIETISLGDPYPWKLTPLDRRLFMKPIEPGVKTNMTVITNKRIYLFEIESDVSSGIDSIDVVHVARFFYPTQTLDKIEDKNYLASTSKLKEILAEKQTTNEVDSINIKYSFAGKQNTSTPIEIFDDKKRTYLRFKNGVSYQDLKIFMPRTKTQKVPVRYKKTGDFIILEGVYSKILVEYKKESTEIFNDILGI
jgi:type IV secretion system protein VirB9